MSKRVALLLGLASIAVVAVGLLLLQGHPYIQQLLFELTVTLSLALLFVVQLEGFGYVLEQGWRWWCRSRGWTSKSDRPIPGLGWLRILLGGLLYTAVFFWIGVLGVLHPLIVLVISAAVPIGAFILGKRWRTFRPTLKAGRREWPILLGLAIFLAATMLFWFRPIFGFDSLWYHLTIPKFFLQEGNIDYNGILLRYSLQPTMTYFWYLWPLSLKLSMPLKGMIINFMQAWFLLASMAYVLTLCRRYLKWKSAVLIAAPLLLGVTIEALNWSFGTGYNDGVSFALGFFVVGLYLVTKHEKMTWELFGLGTLLIIATATLKIYSAIFAVPVLVYFLWKSYRTLPREHRIKRMVLTVGGLGVIFYLPWLVRSYLATGRILDPVGAPGMNEDSYKTAGSLTAQNHWTSFIFVRWWNALPQLATSAYSPLFVIGMASIIHPVIRKKFMSLWVVGFAGFWLVYFFAIVQQWRYMLPAVAIMLFLGLVSLLDSKRLTKFDMAWLFGAGALAAFAIYFNVRTLWPEALWLALGVGILGLMVAGFGWFSRNPKLVIGTVIAILLVWVGVVVRIVGSHSAANYPLTHLNHQQYLDVRLSAIYDLYPGSSEVPKDYTTSEPLFAVGVHNLAYLENPTFESLTTPQYFRGVTSVSELAERLKQHGVRYIVTMDAGRAFPEACRTIGITNLQECQTNDNQYWQVVVRDVRKGPVWLELR